MKRFAARENVYTCQKCGGFTVTIDVDEGTTPFSIRCRAEDAWPTVKGCDGTALSSFYPQGPRPAHIPAPAWEWYRPAQDEVRKLDKASAYHVAMGGLLLRYRAPQPAHGAAPVLHDIPSELHNPVAGAAPFQPEAPREP